MVTGGTRGIGYAIARCLARDGHNLILGYASNAEAACDASEKLQKDFGVTVIWCVCVCMCVCVLYVSTFMSMYVCMYACICMLYVPTFTSIYLRMYACSFTCVYVRRF